MYYNTYIFMSTKQHKLWQVVGLIATLACIVLFVRQPSWPTPDKLLIFAVSVFMIFEQGWSLFKRLAPFVGLLLVYESFRGLVPSLNSRVAYTSLIDWDKAIFFGKLPTTILQDWLWNGQLQWYDFVFYLAYMLHFILPIALLLFIWKTRKNHYWRAVSTYLVLSFAGFLTFLAYPAAPPWMASDKGLIEPITRISSQVWAALGIHDFPSIYNKISPNPVAAMPSLHAAYATLFALFIYKLYGKKWGVLAALYPFLIYLGTVYQGEHYLIDEIVGALYAVLAYFAMQYVWSRKNKKVKKRRK